MEIPNIITTDMGGTSFDVGIIYGGQPAYSFVSNVAQYEYFLPKVEDVVREARRLVAY